MYRMLVSLNNNKSLILLTIWIASCHWAHLKDQILKYIHNEIPFNNYLQYLQTCANFYIYLCSIHYADIRIWILLLFLNNKKWFCWRERIFFFIRQGPANLDVGSTSYIKNTLYLSPSSMTIFCKRKDPCPD